MPLPPEQLFDVAADRHEVHDLSDDPAYADVLADLRGRVDRWRLETVDRGAGPDDPAVIEALAEFGRSTKGRYADEFAALRSAAEAE